MRSKNHHVGFEASAWSSQIKLKFSIYFLNCTFISNSFSQLKKFYFSFQWRFLSHFQALLQQYSLLKFLSTSNYNNFSVHFHILKCSAVIIVYLQSNSEYCQSLLYRWRHTPVFLCKLFSWTLSKKNRKHCSLHYNVLGHFYFWRTW